MYVDYKGVRQALTTKTRIPIPGRFEYVFEFTDEFSAKYCEGTFMVGIRMRGAELYHRGNELILGTFGRNDQLAMMLLHRIEDLRNPV